MKAIPYIPGAAYCPSCDLFEKGELVSTPPLPEEGALFICSKCSAGWRLEPTVCLTEDGLEELPVSRPAPIGWVPDHLAEGVWFTTSERVWAERCQNAGVTVLQGVRLWGDYCSDPDAAIKGLPFDTYIRSRQIVDEDGRLQVVERPRDAM